MTAIADKQFKGSDQKVRPPTCNAGRILRPECPKVKREAGVVGSGFWSEN